MVILILKDDAFGCQLTKEQSKRLIKRHQGTFLVVQLVEKLPADAGDLGSIPSPGRSHVPQSNKPHVPQLLKPEC